MKRMRKKSRINDLMIDAIEYTFVMWLIRQGVFDAFKANFDACFPSSKDLRDRLHAHVRFTLTESYLGPGSLISSAFLYTSTPEGANFWRKQSAAWQRFCIKLKIPL